MANTYGYTGQKAGSSKGVEMIIFSAFLAYS
jgi:hypothetical protein